jgi:outer membrane lipoprotein LolB
MNRIVLVFSLLAALAGCATAPVEAPSPTGAGSLEQHAAALAELDSWRMSGRAAISTPEQAGTVSMVWHQRGEAYAVELRAPWGVGTLRLDGDPRGVMLRTSTGVQEFASEPRELLRRHAGFDLPVEALRYWLIGLPEPGAPAESVVDERGLLSELRQYGWRVRYLRYGEFQNVALPTKLYANGEGIDVRIVVQDWALNP